MQELFTFPNSIKAVVYHRMDNKTIKKLWDSFTLSEVSLDMTHCDDFVFKVGDIALPTLEDGKEYALSVDPNGIAIVGKDYGGLVRGFYALLMKIELRGEATVIEPVSEQSNYILQNRMIHFCVFPENDLYYIKKMIRLSALCQYTHIVIEFWGMLQYDCMKELAWEHAFTKDEARELVTECRELGIEPIPMFNQLGHATASRVAFGKHVVLDQNPRLQRLFTPDGWAWNIESAEVKALLRNVRKELYDLFGEGEYMHIGFDEAYFITKNDVLRAKLPDFLRDLTHEVEAEGRRPMIWMDMLLEKGVFSNCYASGKKEEIEHLRSAAAKSTVFIDWQYRCTDMPIPTLASLKDCGKDVIGAPWYDPKNYTSHIQTVVDNNMFGIMMTTWQTLKQQVHTVLGCAIKCGASIFTWAQYSAQHQMTATLLRRVSFEGNSYRDSGCAKEQIDY